MAEHDMRRKLIQVLKPLHAVPIENRAWPGTPDINYAEGWIECKWLRAWPKKADTSVKLDHPLLDEQRVWLRQRCCRGGKAWVMLQCKREWFLFWGETAAFQIGIATREMLMHHAMKYWPNGLNERELLEVLSGPKV